MNEGLRPLGSRAFVFWILVFVDNNGGIRYFLEKSLQDYGVRTIENIQDITLGFIGAGRVGYALTVLLKKKGLSVAFVVDADREKASRCAVMCGAGSVEISISKIDEKPGIIVIAVPDDAVESIVSDLSACRPLVEGTVVAHTSGLRISDVLAPLRSLGGHVCSVHPAYSFPEAFDGGLEGVPFAVEGDAEACRLMERVVEFVGGRPVRIRKEDKARYHLGCTMASNYLATLASTVDTFLKDIEGIESLEYMLPLIHATLRNIEEVGPVNALTGPIARGDVNTVEAHLQLLKDLDSDGLRTYIAMGWLTLRMAADAGLPDAKREAMESLFRRFEESRV